MSENQTCSSSKCLKRKYTEAELMKAVSACTTGMPSAVLTVRQASAQFNVPKSTLAAYVKNHFHSMSKMGPAPFLRKLKKNFLFSECLSSPRKPSQFARSALEAEAIRMVKLMPNPGGDVWIQKCRCGIQWFDRFFTRHKELVLRKAEILGIARREVTKERLQTFYFLLEALDSVNRFRSHQIYNCDETDIDTDCETLHVIAQTWLPAFSQRLRIAILQQRTTFWPPICHCSNDAPYNCHCWSTAKALPSGIFHGKFSRT